MAKTFMCGNTVRFHAVFRDFNKQLVDPEIVKFIVYDYKYNKLEEVSVNRLSLGTYYYDYTPHSCDSNKKFIAEIYGEIGGKPSIEREEFIVKFLKS